VKDLLPHFEAELAQLQRSAKHFAKEHPKIADRLGLGGEEVEDPHVERLIQSFALLTARVHKRLDDDFPRVTESLLEVLYPHYLRPFPSCSVAHMALSPAALEKGEITHIARGTRLESSQAVCGVRCTFRTASETVLAPISITAAHYQHGAGSARGAAQLPPNTSGVLSLRLQLESTQTRWSDMPAQLRVYLSGESTQVSVLREVLCASVLSVMYQTDAQPAWMGPLAQSVELTGFEPDEALIDYGDRSHPAYRLLSEYFAFPEKFNFLSIPLPTQLGLGEGRCLTLHFVLSGLLADSDMVRVLESVDASSFVLGCVPVVNLFTQRAEPVLLRHTTAQYPLVVNARHASGYEVASIDSVHRVNCAHAQQAVQEIRPFFSIRHGDLLRDGNRPSGAPPDALYWHAERDPYLAVSSPGYETLISVVDEQFDPSAVHLETLSFEVTATNRDLPVQLSAGASLLVQGVEGVAKITLRRKPTHTHRIERGRASLWHLVSHLSLNHLSLSAGGINALKEMLRLYDLPASAANRQQIDALVAIDFAPATVWLPGQPFASFVRGTEVRLNVREEDFVGTGLGLFVAVLDRFFGMYAHLNSFTQLHVFSAHTKKLLIQCLPRSGAHPVL
jgi:type VI secretion system protein ImpG